MCLIVLMWGEQGGHSSNLNPLFYDSNQCHNGTSIEYEHKSQKPLENPFKVQPSTHLRSSSRWQTGTGPCSIKRYREISNYNHQVHQGWTSFRRRRLPSSTPCSTPCFRANRSRDFFSSIIMEFFFQIL